MKQLLTTGAVLASLMTIASPSFAGPEVNTTLGGVLVDGKPAPGLAVRGFDVVAYHTVGKPTQGSAKFAAKFGAATYRFSSKANLQAFKANPSKYVPAYGGFCAYGVSVNAKFDGDPQLWKLVGGRLYLNLNRDIQTAFNKDVSGAIKKADVVWPRIASKLPSEIK
ncbi:MAG: YHS domain-containing (seleno)protein [Hyphomicrobiaceae bacterium]